MDFKRRLRLFIFGILLGSGFVYVVLIRNTNFPAWTPNDRVMEQLKENAINISAKLQCQLSANGLEEKDVAFVLADGKVIFSESKVRNVPEKKYVIEGKASDGRVFKMIFTPSTFKTFAIELAKNENYAATDTCR
jgi:uncharacterized DUF497 family protein